jgi:hypothetical protein
MEMIKTGPTSTNRPVWNSGRTVWAKRALKPKQIWEIRFCLNQRRRLRDRALFDPPPSTGPALNREAFATTAIQPVKSRSNARSCSCQ